MRSDQKKTIIGRLSEGYSAPDLIRLIEYFHNDPAQSWYQDGTASKLTIRSLLKPTNFDSRFEASQKAPTADPDWQAVLTLAEHRLPPRQALPGDDIRSRAMRSAAGAIRGLSHWDKAKQIPAIRETFRRRLDSEIY